MRRRLIVFLSLALLAAACATDGAGQLDAPESSDALGGTPTTTVSATEAPAPTGGVAEPSPEATRPEPDPNRPLAPDFQLALSTGDTYQLSADTNPVFIVFWAEW